MRLKRIISIVLTLCMVIGVFPAVALFDTQAAGTATDTVDITNLKVTTEDNVEVRDYFYNFKKGYTGDTSADSLRNVTYAMTEAGSAY